MKFLVSVLLLVLCFGTVLADPPPGWPPPSYVMTRQWQNIMDYGAKGDGTTDALAAIQAAFDAAPDSGGTVFVPHSDSGFLVTNTLRQPSHVRFLGAGRGSIIRMHPDSSRCILANADTTNGDTGIVVENIFFDGGKTYTLFSDRDSADCISFINVHRSSVRNCWVTRTDCDGIAFRRGTDNKILNNTLWELGEDGITVAGLASGSNIVSGNHVAGRDTSYEVGGLIPSGILCKSSEVVISNNIITEGGAAIDINNESGDTLRDITITTNLFLNCWQTTVSVADGNHLTISSNVFYDCQTEGIFTWAPLDTPSHDIVIASNSFYSQGGIAIRAASGDNYVISNNVVAASDTTALAISGDHVSVIGNRIDTVTSGYGIHLLSCRYSSVCGNVISNIGGRGIYSEGAVVGGEYTTIADNAIRKCTGPGIYLSASDFMAVSGNVCIDNDSAGIWVAGSYNNNVNGNVCTSPNDLQEYGIALSASSKNYVCNNQTGGNASDTGILNPADNWVYANREDTLSVNTFIDFVGRIVLENIENTARIDIRGLDANLRLNATAGNAHIEFQHDTVSVWKIQLDSATQSLTFRAGAVNRLLVATTGAVTFNEAITIPTNDTTAGYVWATNGAGEMVWVPNDTGAGAGGEANTISDTGTYNDTEGFGLAGGKTGVSLKVKGLIEGSNITITKSGDSALTITGAAGSGTADSVGIDTDGNGTVDNYLYSTVAGCAHIKKGSNITLTVAGDTVTIAGDAGSGTADSMGIDTDGDGTVDAYLYSTTAGAFHLKEGTGMALTVAGDTVTIGGADATTTTKGIARFPSDHFDVSSGVVSIKIDAIGRTELKDNDAPVDEDILTWETTGDWLEWHTPGELALMEDEDINTFAELQAWISDKTLLNEEDIATIDVAWTFAALLAADSINTAHLVCGSVYLGNDTLKGVDVLVVDTVVVDGDVIKDFTGTNLSVTNGVLSAAGGGGTADSTYLNDGTQYGPYTNDMYKIKEGTGVNIVREDSTNYDVFKFHTTLGTAVDSNEIDFTTMDEWVSDQIIAHLGGTETGIAVTGQEGTNDIDFVAEVTQAEFDKIADDTANFKTAYGWGNHASQNYLDNDDANVDTTGWSKGRDSGLVAWNWGDHSAAGYLSSLNELFGYFDRTYFDTAADAGGDSIVCIYSDSTTGAERAARADSATIAADSYAAHKDKDGDSINVSSYVTTETDPVWVSDSGDYSMKTWVRTEIEDSLNEYSLTSAIPALFGPFIDTTTLDTIQNAHEAVAADSAGKALQDAAGNTITTTYAPIASPTFTGIVTIPDMVLTTGAGNDAYDATDVPTNGQQLTWATGGVINWQDAGAAGGGTTDSIGFVLGGVTKWQVDKALKIAMGYGFANSTITDSSGTDTTTVVVDTANTVADAEAKVVTGNAVFDFCETTKNYALNSELHNWTDSTGFLVGWGGVSKSVVNDTNYFRFEGSSDFDTTGGSVSIATDKVTPAHIDDGADTPVDEEIVTYEATGTKFEYHTPGELALMEDEDINTFAELQSWVSDKTLLNEEDIFTIDANWVNTANPWADNEVADNISVDEASDVDTSGTKISAALATRLDDLLSDIYKYFDRTYFDTLIDASGDSIICVYSDSTDMSIFDTDDLAEGSNKYDQALPDSSEWSTAYDSSQVGYLNPADANVDTAAWNAAGAGEANTLSDTGTFNDTEGFGLAGGKTGVALKVKGLIEGTSVTITASGDSAYTIAASGAGLTYWSESENGDTSFWTAGGGNTELGMNDNLSMRGNNVVDVGTVDTVDVGVLAAKVHKEDLNYYMFNLADPDALYATDHEWSIDPRTAQAITIDSFTVSLDADPTTELTFSLKFADALIGFANAVVIDDTATVAGVTTVTGGFGDATVPAGKCVYWLFDADPDDAITQASVKIYYSID